MDPEIVAAAVGGIFGAGVAWGTVKALAKRTQNDVNGIGKKLTAHIVDTRTEIERMKMGLLLLTPYADLEKMIDRFWPK